MSGANNRLGLVVEDLDETRDFLAACLTEALPGMSVSTVGDLASARAWVAERLTPATVAVVLVDLGLPDGSGIDLIRLLADRYPAALPVVTTIFDDDRHLFDAIAAGAQGYLLKDQDAPALVTYLRRIDGGEQPLSPSIARRILGHFRRPTPAPETALTPRETDVLQLIGRGLRVNEAASILGLTDHTVAGYVKSIYRKLNVSSRAEAALEAARLGLV
ncbi:LuxR C-terminal-related transcriptional regulator [Zavarzinia sp.]|uniref:LuxR C-terminal-related transcriptional regulator n=1 Tax=Zavarzinia sp. TaxID=2027920 RepID=UPI0035652D0F